MGAGATQSCVHYNSEHFSGICHRPDTVGPLPTSPTLTAACIVRTTDSRFTDELLGLTEKKAELGWNLAL